MTAFSATGSHPPPRRPVGRRNGWSADKKRVFLAMLDTCLNVRRAAAAVGLSARAAYQLKERDPAFARAWRAALASGYAELEFELLRTAIEGSERTETVRDGEDGPVREVRTVHSVNHGMAMRLLAAHRAEAAAAKLVEAERHGDDEMAARVRAHMDLVRGRLVGPGADAVSARVLAAPVEETSRDDRDTGEDGGEAGGDGGSG